jgi:hypothetical protein
MTLQRSLRYGVNAITPQWQVKKKPGTQDREGKPQWKTEKQTRKPIFLHLTPEFSHKARSTRLNAAPPAIDQPAHCVEPL